MMTSYIGRKENLPEQKQLVSPLPGNIGTYDFLKEAWRAPSYREESQRIQLNAQQDKLAIAQQLITLKPQFALVNEPFVKTLSGLLKNGCGWIWVALGHHLSSSETPAKVLATAELYAKVIRALGPGLLDVAFETRLKNQLLKKRRDLAQRQENAPQWTLQQVLAVPGGEEIEPTLSLLCAPNDPALLGVTARILCLDSTLFDLRFLESLFFELGEERNGWLSPFLGLARFGLVLKTMAPDNDSNPDRAPQEEN